MDKYEPNELFIYTNGGRWELGQVKSECVDGKAYFCWYSRGDTAARTPTENMHKLANTGWTHVDEYIEQLEQLCRDMYHAEVALYPEDIKTKWVERMDELGLLEGESHE